MIDDGKGASEGRLASSIPRIGECYGLLSGTYKHEGKRDVPPLKGNVFIDTHMATHRSPGREENSLYDRGRGGKREREEEW